MEKQSLKVHKILMKIAPSDLAYTNVKLYCRGFKLLSTKIRNFVFFLSEDGLRMLVHFLFVFYPRGECIKPIDLEYGKNTHLNGNKKS